MRLRLLAAALELQHLTSLAANVVLSRAASAWPRLCISRGAMLHGDGRLTWAIAPALTGPGWIHGVGQMLQDLADAIAAHLVHARSTDAKLRRLDPAAEFLGTSNCEAKVRAATWLISGTATAAALFSFAHAADPSSDPYGLWKPLQGAVYKFHSRVVADRAPTTGERTPADHRRGQQGGEGHLRVDRTGLRRGTCSDAKGDRHRRKKEHGL